MRYVITTDAADLIVPLVKEFNQMDQKVGGRRVNVSWTILASGNALDRIHAGMLKPAAWTPASSLWAGLLNAKSGTRYVPELGRSMVQSPQVIAIFQTSANRTRLTSSESLERVLEKAAAGELSVGHTDPNISTSGLSEVLSEFYLATGKDAQTLQRRDVLNPVARQRVRRWEGSIAHYVDIGKDFKDLWCNYSSSFADAAYMQETTFLEFNRTCKTQLVAIYPSDFPLIADYPYIVLDAGWITAAQRQGAKRLGEWLEDRLSKDCAAVAENGFRREGCRLPAPDLPPVTLKPSRQPNPLALAEVQQAWGMLRRPAHVMLVVDQTLQMAKSGRLQAAKDALTRGGDHQPAFLACTRPQDEVGMITFGGGSTSGLAQPVPLRPSDPAQVQRLEGKINVLAAEQGRAALSDALELALGTREMVSSESINTIVLLSFGTDDAPPAALSNLLSEVRGLYRSKLAVQILLVPYSDPATLGPLMDLVTASLGRPYDDKDTAASGDDASDATIANVSKFVCGFL